MVVERRLVVLVSSLLMPACQGSPADSETGSADAGSSTVSPTGDTGDEPTTAGQAVCCGCLCIDPAWSCAADTCVTAEGTVTALAPEAGFLAIAPHDFSTYASDGSEVVHHAPEARQWYAFRPADERPEDKPLAVFFNGGPGNSSAILFGLNTNAVTLDPDIVGDAAVAANPHSWTRFANVLYLDPREAGYSYTLAGPREVPPLEFTPEHDAADFVRTLLAFLARHPQIQDNPVVLVGESYGGTRAAVMLAQLLLPGRLDDTRRYRDPALQEAVYAHFAAVFPDRSADELTPALLASQFGHQVHIQPAITWLQIHNVPYTPDHEQPVELGCVEMADPAQCDEPALWSYERANAVIDTITDPQHLAAAFGVDITTIEWMYADARADALPRPIAENDMHDETGLRATFGELAPDHLYYDPVRTPDNDSWMAGDLGLDYLESFYYTRAFITDAGKDTVVYAPDIPVYLASFAHVITAAVHDRSTHPDEARPGWLRLDYVPELGPGPTRRDLRFPHYPTAGHMVSHRQGGELASDVCRWLLEDCPL